MTLLLPLGAALSATNKLAVLGGHGPNEPDLAQAILHNAPVTRPVWINQHGRAVAVADNTSNPPRRDPAAVRKALLNHYRRRAKGPTSIAALGTDQLPEGRGAAPTVPA